MNTQIQSTGASVDAPQASAQSIAWGPDVHFDTGLAAVVSINSSLTVVNVHDASGYGKLFYATGSVDNSNPTVPSITWNSAVNYDTGAQPAVAMNDSGTVVEVHQSNRNTSDLWYHVGAVQSNGTIEWGKSINYDHGINPSIALNENNVAVEVHEGSGNIWYRVGTVNPNDKTITWGPSTSYQSGADTPKIALNSSNIVVEVHGLDGDLYTLAGVVQPASNTISWGTLEQPPSGSWPSITVNDNDSVVLAYQSSGNLMEWTGTVVDNGPGYSIQWSYLPQQFDNGRYVSVALANSDCIVQVHNDANGLDLWCAAGNLIG